jgi:hypothetical protein
MQGNGAETALPDWMSDPGDVVESTAGAQTRVMSLRNTAAGFPPQSTFASMGGMRASCVPNGSYGSPPRGMQVAPS